MPTDEKRQAVAELTELLRGSTAVAVADYRGLRVGDMQSVRRALAGNDVAFTVVKNRLMSIAADEAGLAELKPMLSGPTALATGSGDEVTLARSVLDALRPYSRVVKVRGGVIGRRMIGAEDLQRLSTMPGREVLLGRLGGGMQAPIAALASVLAGNIRNLVGVLNAVAEKKQQQSAPQADGAAAES